MSLLPTELILEDKEKVYFDKTYIVDGTIRRSEIHGTVAQLKEKLKAKVIRSFDSQCETRRNCRVGEKLCEE